MNRIALYRRFKELSGNSSYKNIRYPYGNTAHWQAAVKSLKSKKATKATKVAKKATKSTKVAKKATKSTKSVKIPKRVAKRTGKHKPVVSMKARINNLLRANRRYYIADGIKVVRQDPFVDTNLSYFDILEIKEVEYFNEHIKYFLKRAFNALFKSGQVIRANIQFLYKHIDGEILHTNGAFVSPNTDMNDILPQQASLDSMVILGFKILPMALNYGRIIDRETLADLRAYHPSSNTKYHELCSVSTSQNNKICIYETWYHININSIKYTKRESTKYQKKIESSLENEGQEINEAVINGELFKSLQILTTKYNNSTLVQFHNENLIVEVSKGKIIEKPKLENYIGKEIFYYERGVHVSPIKYSGEIKKEEKEKKQQKYKLRKQILKNQTGHKNKSADVLVMSTTKTNINNKLSINKSIIYGIINGQKINQELSGVDEIVKFLNKISTRKNSRKSKAKEKIDEIVIYGCGNSNFENLLILSKLYEEDPQIKYIYSKTKISEIKFRNIKIQDLSSFYGISKLDKLVCTMGQAMPYHPVYSMYEIAMTHYSKLTGKINDRFYNLNNCSTSASMALKEYNQIFQNDTLMQSPDEIYEIEQKTYYGGRNEVFKKTFESNNEEMMYYTDLNAAHAYSMTKEMPNNFTKRYKYKKWITVTNKKELIKINSYYARSTYEGTDDNYIPVLLSRKDKIYSTKNTEGWYWGAELREAHQDGCKIEYLEECVYESKKLFDQYVNYHNDKKTQAKQEDNKAEYAFQKSMLTNLYGKWGQKFKTNKKIINSMDEIQKLTKPEKITSWAILDNKLLIEYEKPKEEQSVGKLVRFSSYISCLTRCRLAKIMRDVGHENVYYVNTDSLFTTKKPSDKYISSTKLGMLKYESQPIIEAVFLGPNRYYYTDINGESNKKFSGIDSNLLDVSDYKSVLSGNQISKKQTITSRLNNIIKLNERNRRITSTYDKRIWIGNNSIAYNSIHEIN